MWKRKPLASMESRARTRGRGGGPRQKMRVEWETRAGAAELGEDNLSKERAAVYFGQIEG